MTASVLTNVAWRSRGTTCVLIGSTESPSPMQTFSSTSGGTVACEPTAPLILPYEIWAFASARRPWARRISAAHPASLRPKVVGSAWTPCVRPMQMVSLNSMARRSTTSRRSWRSCSRIVAESRNWSAVAVSHTSCEVSPRWTQRPSSPRLSATDFRNAVTSWWVSAW